VIGTVCTSNVDATYYTYVYAGTHLLAAIPISTAPIIIGTVVAI
jgi:hypothetical protein